MSEPKIIFLPGEIYLCACGDPEDCKQVRPDEPPTAGSDVTPSLTLKP